eukprot:TRINITY_DN6550_c0_g1_i1.p1 TRINITY_DN6550_c0_g1~~TRINITY_DN6550_c0_g1_i1.p1  ORF type:complete len:883 (-),score=174.13 TRINITY_DN6550_c0_g1_i1:14-2662(-)
MKATYLACIVLVLCTYFSHGSIGQRVQFKLDNWRLTSSANVSETGAELSSVNYDDSWWYTAQLPCTVMACLVQNGLYENVYYGKNLLNVNTSQFNTTWWYRAEFSSQNVPLNGAFVVSFHGINYKANIWVNGIQIGNDSIVVGTFRYFEFDLTLYLTTTNNAIAVEVFEPHDRSIPFNNPDTDLAITFVDWAPFPPDSNMGLWREVEVTITGDVGIKHPMVETVLSNNNNVAHLTVMAELTNYQQTDVTGRITGTIVNLQGTLIAHFSKEITLVSGSSQVFFRNSTFPALNIQSPDWWWPWQMGNPTLHILNLNFTIDGDSVASDNLSTRFGIRQTEGGLDNNGYRLFKVNNQPILIRGAGWSPDLFLRKDDSKLLDEFNYVRDMNLNSIRLEGKMEPDFFFDIADEMGILILPGWCCCDSWQRWSLWQEEQYYVSAESMRTQIKRLRIHPSVLVFLLSSDELPPQKVERNYLRVIDEEPWPNPTVSAASEATSKITGPTGVKMTGPYSWVPPNYWLEDTNEYGGAYGFLTEGGPGENPESYESFVQIVPIQDLWPINSDWNFHCGYEEGNFGNLNRFTPPLYLRYGNATNVQDYLYKSQVAAYEGHRAMFEGYSRNKYIFSTGVIQWMLNNAFPSMIWHLYTYDLNPTSTYFATKKSCELTHIQYSYDDNSVYIVNSDYNPIKTNFLIATAKVVLVNGNVIFSTVQPVYQVAADSSLFLFFIPSPQDIRAKFGGGVTYFVKLELFLSSDMSLVSDNFYWLSTTVDILLWDNSTWYNTPLSQYANFTQLMTLPKVDLAVTSTSGVGYTKVNVTNSTPYIAFFIHVRVVDTTTNQDVFPIIWDENYFSLLSGESRMIVGTYSESVSDPVQVIVEVFNNVSGGK